MTLIEPGSSAEQRAQMLAHNLTYVRSYAADVSAAFTRAISVKLPHDPEGIISARQTTIERAQDIESAINDLRTARTYADDKTITDALLERQSWLCQLLSAADAYIKACHIALDTAKVNTVLDQFNDTDHRSHVIIPFIPQPESKSIPVRFDDLVYTLHEDSRTARWDRHFVTKPYYKNSLNRGKGLLFNMRDQNEFDIIGISATITIFFFFALIDLPVAIIMGAFVAVVLTTASRYQLKKSAQHIDAAPQVNMDFIRFILRHYKKGINRSLSTIFYESEYINQVKGDTEHIVSPTTPQDEAHYKLQQRATTEWLNETMPLLCAVYADSSKPTPYDMDYNIPEKYEDALFIAVSRYDALTRDPEHERYQLDEALNKKMIAKSGRDAREDVVMAYLDRQKRAINEAKKL